MLGISEIAHYIPEARLYNKDQQDAFGVDANFLEEKLGVLARSIKGPSEKTSDLCVKAFERLVEKRPIDPTSIDAIVVVTQNPDYPLPHVSAILQDKLGLNLSCACFDISLGCSGYVYGLSVLQAFLGANGMKRGLLFTADPYSAVIDPSDKNTAMIFGDAASVSLIEENPLWITGKFSFGTAGARHRSLIVENGKLSMNGRDIFSFAAVQVPQDLKKMLANNGSSIAETDYFVLHPGSKFIVDTIAQRLALRPDQYGINIRNFGNTVSSAVPISLENVIHGSSRTIALAGFGVGLSWSSTLLRKNI